MLVGGVGRERGGEGQRVEGSAAAMTTAACTAPARRSQARQVVARARRHVGCGGVQRLREVGRAAVVKRARGGVSLVSSAQRATRRRVDLSSLVTCCAWAQASMLAVWGLIGQLCLFGSQERSFLVSLCEPSLCP